MRICVCGGGQDCCCPEWTQGIRQYGAQTRWGLQVISKVWLYLKFFFYYLNHDHSLASVVSGRTPGLNYHSWMDFELCPQMSKKLLERGKGRVTVTRDVHVQGKLTVAGYTGQIKAVEQEGIGREPIEFAQMRWSGIRS